MNVIQYLRGAMMGLELSNLNAPVTKIVNCLLAPDYFEYAEPEPEQAVFAVLAVLMPAQST